MGQAWTDEDEYACTHKPGPGRWLRVTKKHGHTRSLVFFEQQLRGKDHASPRDEEDLLPGACPCKT